jgi:hypothetical protein
MLPLSAGVGVAAMHFPSMFYWSSSVLCFCALLAHELLGAPMVLPPLLESGLSGEVIWLHHFSWHVGSVATAGMIAMYISAARKPENRTMAWIATAMSFGFAILGIGLAIHSDGALWRTPAPYIWSVLSILGTIGIVTQRRTG